MQKAIRLTATLVAALAFTAAWADDKKCEAKDMPCATAVMQDGTSQDALSAGSGAGEPAGASMSADESIRESYQDLIKHEVWESGD
jgi:hypothetical protein